MELRTPGEDTIEITSYKGHALSGRQRIKRLTILLKS